MRAQAAPNANTKQLQADAAVLLAQQNNIQQQQLPTEVQQQKTLLGNVVGLNVIKDNATANKGIQEAELKMRETELSEQKTKLQEAMTKHNSSLQTNKTQIENNINKLTSEIKEINEKKTKNTELQRKIPEYLQNIKKLDNPEPASSTPTSDYYYIEPVNIPVTESTKNTGIQGSDFGSKLFIKLILNHGEIEKTYNEIILNKISDSVLIGDLNNIYNTIKREGLDNEDNEDNEEKDNEEKDNEEEGKNDSITIPDGIDPDDKIKIEKSIRQQKIEISQIERNYKNMTNYKALESKFINLREYQKAEEQYTKYIEKIYAEINNEYNQTQINNGNTDNLYDIKTSITEVTNYRTIAKTQKKQSYIYPKYPRAISNIYLPLNNIIPIETPGAILTIKQNRYEIKPPPPPYSRVPPSDADLNKKREKEIALITEQEQEQEQYNSSDNAEKKIKSKNEKAQLILDPARIIIKYDGDRNETKMKDGHGVAYYKNGNKYEGTWHNDIKLGAGISTELINYITGEIGCVCKYYYKGFNILNNTIRSSDKKNIALTNIANIISQSIFNNIRTTIDQILSCRENPQSTNDCFNNAQNKYSILHNFEKEVEEEQSRNSIHKSNEVLPPNLTRPPSVKKGDEEQEEQEE